MYFLLCYTFFCNSDLPAYIVITFPTCSTLSFKGWCHSRIFLWGGRPSLWATLSVGFQCWLEKLHNGCKISLTRVRSCFAHTGLRPSSASHLRSSNRLGRREEGGSGDSSGHRIVKSRDLSRPQRQTRFRAPWHVWLMAALFSPHPDVPEQLPRRAQSLQPVANEPDCPTPTLYLTLTEARFSCLSGSRKERLYREPWDTMHFSLSLHNHKWIEKLQIQYKEFFSRTIWV